MSSGYPGYCYVLYTEINGEEFFKIGRAKRRDRYKAYSVVAPIPTKLVCDSYYKDCCLAERGFHDVFNEIRAEGEWFRLNPYHVIILASSFLANIFSNKNEYEIMRTQKKDLFGSISEDLLTVIEYTLISGFLNEKRAQETARAAGLYRYYNLPFSETIYSKHFPRGISRGVA